MDDEDLDVCVCDICQSVTSISKMTPEDTSYTRQLEAENCELTERVAELEKRLQQAGLVYEGEDENDV